MISLAPERVGPWVRALGAAVAVAAPNDDFVPVGAASAHLHALDPELSGDVLAPAEIDPCSGMPALAWMTRATAEKALGVRVSEPSGDVQRLDPALAERMRARAALSRHLRDHPLLPTLSVQARVRRAGQRSEGFVVFDHIDPEGCWVRTRVELRGQAYQTDLGLMHVHEGGVATVPDGVHDVFARHVRTPLPSLYATLQDVSGDAVVRASRARIGPYGFPGGPWQHDAPASVQRTLVLHAVHEVIGENIRATRIVDPFDTSPVSGSGALGQRHRRLAVFRSGVEAVRQWLGDSVGITPF